MPETYFSAFGTAAYLGIIEDWLNNGMQESPEEMAMIYLKIKFFGMKC
ncbi:TetR-like C-terminal domain-containing protein [Paenibacillus terrigena]